MPFVQGGDMPDRLWATNATIPPLNEWCRLNPEQLKQFEATDAAIARAKEVAEGREARKRARVLKHRLFEAIAQHDLEASRQLLRSTALLERHTPYGATPLCLAAAVGDVPICSLLLEMGASPTAADGIGATPLIMAAFRGHTEVAKLLLSAKMGGLAGREYMLRQCTRGGETAVMAAAKAGALDTLQALLAAGAQPGTRDARGLDALMLACKHNKLETAQHLMQACGLSPASLDREGRNALMHAARGAADKTVEMLLQQQPPLDLTAVDMQGLSALDHACMGGSTQAMGSLMKAASFNAADPAAGGRLVSLAAQAGQAEAVRWLLKQGVGLQSLTELGDGNPMFSAVRGEAMGVVEVLLAHGARLEVRDARGRSPLALAARQGKDRMVRLLVSRGADLLAADLHGRVPRALAQLHRHSRTAQLLSDLAKDRLLVPNDQLEKERQAEAAEREAMGGVPFALPSYPQGPVPPAKGPAVASPLKPTAALPTPQ